MSEVDLLANRSEERAADVPRPPDWEGRYLDSREKQLEGQPWYPKVMAPPATVIPPRYRAFEVDEGGFQASVSPQKWETPPAVNVPAGLVRECWPATPGAVKIEIENTGANPVVVSPTPDQAANAVGKTIANGAVWTIETQAAGFVYSVNGSTVQVVITRFEAPNTHVPPKKKEE